jgi:uncharacterized protein YyaL (SSP411 family)
MTAHRNRLANETSPYLLQHAANPVDWYPWGTEALNKAKAENKPIFLSIGYSACHWCHVMERESFENAAIAAIMNRYFVNVKVDREERPDLDDFYMTFVQMTTGSGGWPMSVFLTPDGTPFFGGTYFPPEDAYSRRGFPFILNAVAETWEQQQQQVLDSSTSLLSDLQANHAVVDQGATLKPEILDEAVQQMLDRFDPVEGGFGGAPKFPPSYSLSLLMKQYSRGQNPFLLKAITRTLDRMAYGGMYDQLGGGFHRYSVDAKWLVPHFEKMLYDNALLAVTYLEAFQLTGKLLYREIATGILDYILRDMHDPAGGFYSSEDADSEGIEGKFYVWTPEEVFSALGSQDGKLFCDYYDVTNSGNFEHNLSILHIRVDTATFARSYGLTPEELEVKLLSLRAQLLELRGKRIRPHKDDKVLTEWNGLMLSAFAKGYQVTDDSRYLDAARDCARFLEITMLKSDGLLRVYRQEHAKQHGFLADYAFTTNGLIDLYEASFEIHWLKLAIRLADEMIAKFCDTNAGGFFMTLANQPDLPVRPRDSYDGAVPSGNSVAAMALLRLSVLLDRKDFLDLALGTISSLGGSVNRVPIAYMNLLNAFDFSQYRPTEIAIVGHPSDLTAQALLQVAHSTYVPNKVIAFLDPDDPNRTEIQAMMPLLQNRATVDATAYVCKNYVCKLPVTEAAELARQLTEPHRPL